VGVSFGGPDGLRAFLWQGGELKNLTDLVNIAPDVLLPAQDINDAGQITGRAARWRDRPGSGVRRYSYGRYTMIGQKEVTPS
jgi:hypothetical protein